MEPSRIAAKHWRSGAIAGLLFAGICAALPIYGAGVADHSVWRTKFQRPSEIPFPDDNPYTPAKAALGRMLFFDPILSGGQGFSCATCHNPSLAWTDNRPRGFGEKQMATRTPTLLNVAWVPKPGWDGRFRDLEAVAPAPIFSPGIMNLPENVAVERLSAIPAYVDAFDAAFGEGAVTRRKIELALATFERSIVSAEAPFDRWIKGDANAIAPAAKRGFALFTGKAMCAQCHNGWAFTDWSFYDIGIGKDDDIGRGKHFPNSTALRYAFKTPTLRDLSKRAPYMHDGSLETLEAVVEHYDRGGIERPSRSEYILPLHLSKDEKADLVAFLRTLDSPHEPYPLPNLPRR